MNLFKSTQDNIKYWANRDIDWKTAYFDTWNHPHRDLLMDILKKFRFGSLLEIGCASGPNLFRIRKEFPFVDAGGVDINEKALEAAKRLTGIQKIFTGHATHLFFSDKSVDLVLTDMTLIYVSRSDIKKALQEIRRVGRKYVVLCEFYSEKWIDRLRLKWASGYNAYNYKQLLENEGFYDIIIMKIPEASWPGGNPQKDFGYIITARI